MTAFFNKKTATPQKGSKKVSTSAMVTHEASSSVSASKVGALPLAMVLIRPHVTEKATDLAERGVYAFEINKRANKMHVRQAVEQLYKVRPIKIAVVLGKPKLMKNPRTGRVQTKKIALKKALVYLKKGDKIELV